MMEKCVSGSSSKVGTSSVTHTQQHEMEHPLAEGNNGKPVVAITGIDKSSITSKGFK